MNNLKTKLKFGSWACVRNMSILNYFKKKTGLPDPKGSLSSSITPTAKVKVINTYVTTHFKLHHHRPSVLRILTSGIAQ